MTDKLLKAVVQTTDIGIIALAADGAVLLWNQWMERASGILATHTVGKSLTQIFPELADSRLQQAIGDAINNGRSALLSSAWNLYTLPLHQTESTDKRLLQSLIVKPIRIDNEAYCVIEIFDVTNSNHREALLREKTKESIDALNIAETASKTKSEFVSTVSHELRTPLTAINGALGLLIGGVVGAIPEKAVSLIEVANSNTTRLLSIINDLLDIEKIEAGQMEFIYSQVDLNTLCAQSVGHNQNYALSHNVKIHFIPNAQPLLVYADSHRISQVLSNLLSNAAKFSYPNQDVIVSLQKTENDYCRVTVQNYGKGIPERYQDTLFEKFTQVKENQTSSKGTGLGLNISRAIIKQHDGMIGFHSTPNESTIFYFELKLYEARN